MPKSKVRKKPTTATVSRNAPSVGVSRATTTGQRVKVAGPSSTFYIVVMLGLMLLGLAWLVVNYLAGSNIPGMRELGNWNFAIGFALIIAGLLMTMRWR